MPARLGLGAKARPAPKKRARAGVGAKSRPAPRRAPQRASAGVGARSTPQRASAGVGAKRAPTQARAGVGAQRNKAAWTAHLNRIAARRKKVAAQKAHRRRIAVRRAKVKGRGKARLGVGAATPLRVSVATNIAKPTPGSDIKNFVSGANSVSDFLEARLTGGRNDAKGRNRINVASGQLIGRNKDLQRADVSQGAAKTLALVSRPTHASASAWNAIVKGKSGEIAPEYLEGSGRQAPKHQFQHGGQERWGKEQVSPWCHWSLWETL